MEPQASYEIDDTQFIAMERGRLRLHLGLEDRSGLPSTTTPRKATLFFVERAPGSSTGKKCKLPSCTDIIKPYDYQLVLKPAMRTKDVVDCYHISCFEKIADFTDGNFNARIRATTRNSLDTRDFQSKQMINVLDGDYLLDGGAERLVLEWKARRGKWINLREGFDQEEVVMDPALNGLLRRAGSSTYVPQAVPNMSLHEHNILSRTLAPFESYGLGDTEEWNLFATYLNGIWDFSSLDEQYTLNNILQHWKHDQELVRIEEHRLTDAQRRAKAKLGAKAITAIERLSDVPLPVFPSTHLDYIPC